MEYKQGAVGPKRTWGPLIFISKFKFLEYKQSIEKAWQKSQCRFYFSGMHLQHLSCLSVSPNQRHRVLKLDKLTVHSQRLSSIPTGKMEVGGEGGGTALDLHPIPPPSLNSYTPQRHDQVLPVFSIRWKKYKTYLQHGIFFQGTCQSDHILG